MLYSISFLLTLLRARIIVSNSEKYYRWKEKKWKEQEVEYVINLVVFCIDKEKKRFRGIFSRTVFVGEARLRCIEWGINFRVQYYKYLKCDKFIIGLRNELHVECTQGKFNRFEKSWSGCEQYHIGNDFCIMFTKIPSVFLSRFVECRANVNTLASTQKAAANEFLCETVALKRPRYYSHLSFIM